MAITSVVVLVLAVAALASGHSLVQSSDDKALMEAVEEMLKKGKEQDLPMFAESEQDNDDDEYGDSEDYEEYDAEEEDYHEEDSDADIEDDEDDDYGGIEDYDGDYADTEEEDGDDYGGIEDYGDIEDYPDDITPRLSVQGANGPDEEDINDREGVDDKFFEGDIALTRRQKSIIGGNGQLEELTDEEAIEEAWKKAVRKWKNGVVPYVLDKSLTKKTRRVIRSAMRYMRKRSGGCVRFTRRKRQSDYVRFFSGNGCWSYIGRNGGQQRISIKNRGCATRGIVAHEIFHTLGRWHEQSRCDRRKFVRIILRNVKKGKEGNFKKRPKSGTQGIRYDYGSIMHYGSKAFTKNGKRTIVARRRGGNNKMGQRTRLSKYDVKHLKKAYCKC